MTQRKMQELLNILEAQEKALKAAKKPIYGPVNHDRAVDEMYDVDHAINVDSPSHD